MMKAILKTEPGIGAVLRNVPVPKPAKDEVLIKVFRASICGSDMAIYNWNSWAPTRFKRPMVFGHEFCGEVVELGSSSKGLAKGDFVSVESHIFCGLCLQCRNGQRHVCQNLKIIGIDCPGGFAEFACVPARCAWKHPDRSLKDIGSLMEPLGNAIYATLCEEVIGKSVLVLGCGPQGLFALQAARASGARPIIAVEGVPYRARLAKKMGADFVFDPADSSVLGKVLDVCQEAPSRHKHPSQNGSSRPAGVDVVLEMSGNAQAIGLGLKCVRSGGRLSAFGIPSGPLPVRWADDIVFKGIRVIGIAGREIYRTWQMMERLLQSGAVNVRPAITHVFPLRDFKKAFELMGSKDKKCAKIVLQASR